METTLMIITRNRSEKLSKTVSIIMSQETSDILHIIILDGSDNKQDIDMNKILCEKYDSIQYYDTEIENFYERVNFGLNKVKTKTVSLLDDEDVLTVDGLFECVKFLNNNLDYSTAAGDIKHLHISKGTKFDKFNLYSLNYHDSNENENVYQRLWDVFILDYNDYYYCVHRTDNLRQMQKLLLKYIPHSDNFSMEMVFSILPVLFGKCKVLNVKYLIRCVDIYFIDDKVIPRYPSFFDYIFNIEVTKKPLNDVIDYNTKVVLKALPFNDREQMEKLIKVMIGYRYAKYINYMLECKDDRCDELRQKYNIQVKTYKRSIYMSTLIKTFIPIKFRYNEIPINSQIVIYGAGDIGIHIYNQLINNNRKVIFFIDKYIENIDQIPDVKVFKLENLSNIKFDCIILATLSHIDVFENNLKQQGILSDNIIKIEKSEQKFELEEIIKNLETI